MYLANWNWNANGIFCVKNFALYFSDPLLSSSKELYCILLLCTTRDFPCTLMKTCCSMQLKSMVQSSFHFLHMTTSIWRGLLITKPTRWVKTTPTCTQTCRLYHQLFKVKLELQIKFNDYRATLIWNWTSDNSIFSSKWKWPRKNWCNLEVGKEKKRDKPIRKGLICFCSGVLHTIFSVRKH
jgi:hypothetical protein